MEKKLNTQEREGILHALYDLHNRCTVGKLRVDVYSALYDQFDDLLRQVDATLELLQEYGTVPLHRREKESS